ncbi:MAG: M56 family metallopeptidase [Planctomycetes bacterium]|nr:M56 family metallopeptidase [Planctomycetota bacterium]
MTSSWLLARIVELAANYLVQSTLFLSGTWGLIQLLSRIQDRRLSSGQPPRPWNPVQTERLWKLAAVLALVTAPMSVFTGWPDPLWAWTLRGESPQAAEVVSSDIPPAPTVAAEPWIPIAATTIPAGSTVLVDPDDIEFTEDTIPASGSQQAIPPVNAGRKWWPSHTNHLRSTEASHVSAEMPAAAVVEAGSEPVLAGNGLPRQTVLPGLGLLLLAWWTLSGSRLFLKHLALHTRLRRCEPSAGPARNQLNRLISQGDSIRLLSAGPAIDTEPFACGLCRWTIVLPAGIEQELAPAELRALLAHEVAHLVRRDPWWLLLSEILCTCFAFQPLNFLARRRWQQAAELLCDDWAVEQQVSTTSLANCLTRIAEWRLNRQATSLGLAAGGQQGSLTQRIEWLLRPGRTAESRRKRGRIVATLVTFAAGLLIGLYGPRLSFVPTAEAADETETIAEWDEIQRELAEAANELAVIESKLANDPAAIVLARKLRQRAAALQDRIDR